MLEPELLRIEDAVRGIVAGAMKLASEASQHIVNRSPWSFARVHEGRELSFPRDPTTLGNLDVHRSLDDVRNMMFHDPLQSSVNEERFNAMGKGRALNLVNYNFFDRRYQYENRGLFWGAYGLDDFLARYVFARMQSSGRAYVAMHWKRIRRRHLIERLEILDEEEIRPVRIGSRRGSFRYVERWRHAFPRRSPEVQYLSRDGVASFVLGAPFASRPGVTRLPEAHRLARRVHALMDAQLAALHASTYQNDRRWWVERARLLNGEKLMDEWRSTQVRVRGVLGGMPSLSSLDKVTKYFDAVGVLLFYERVAQARESLLAEFNSQVVGELLHRNSLDRDAAKVVAVGVCSAAEWGRRVESFASGELAYEEMGKWLGPAPSDGSSG